MVSARKLLKVLHCKRTYGPKPRERSLSLSSLSDDEPLSRRRSRKVLQSGRKIKKQLSVKRERKERTGHTCRICLRPDEGEVPIFGNDRYNDVSQDLIQFTGINLKKDDGHPQYLCENCNNLLQGAIQLRSSAQYSQHVLLNQRFNDSNDEHDTSDYVPYKHRPAKGRPQPEKWYCKRCQVHFESEEVFHKHRLSDEHEKLKKSCPICGKVYDATYLKAHLKYHSTKIVNICDVCGKEFRIKGHFIQHRKIHVHELPFKCRWCPYRCRFNYALKVHMRTHTGEKPYVCEHCPDKSFINKSNLNRHLLTHKTGHDFMCDMCQRGFYHKTDLENHFKADHMGIKEHICDICEKAFGLRSQMMKHKLKVHRREKLRSGRVPLYLRAEYQADGPGEVMPLGHTLHMNQQLLQ